jgi:Xaa-Pro aminopeptidase
MQKSLALLRRRSLATAFLLLGASLPASAQIPNAEFAARRDALAVRIENGVLVSFGARALVNDFGTFFQAPPFHYLTNYDEPDAAFVMVVRNKKAASTLFVTRLNARTAFYYGQRADTGDVLQRYGITGRSFSALSSVVDSLAGSGLPFYTIADVEDADFARADTLTRQGIRRSQFGTPCRSSPSYGPRNRRPRLRC